MLKFNESYSKKKTSRHKKQHTIFFLLKKYQKHTKNLVVIFKKKLPISSLHVRFLQKEAMADL